MAIERFTVRRVISSRGVAPQTIIDALQALPGVAAAQTHGDGRVLATYDVRHAHFDTLERTAAGLGAVAETGWTEKLRRAWIRYGDETLRSEVDLPESPCCGETPFPQNRCPPKRR